MDKKAFVDFKTSERHYKPTYFSKMEEYNLKGSPPLGRLPKPKPYDAKQTLAAMDQGVQVLDVRSPEAIAGAFVPDSLTIPLNMVPAYAGWFLSYHKGIILIVDCFEQVEATVKHLVRMGYDSIPGFLTGGLHAWEVAGLKYDRIPTLHASDLKRRLDDDEDLLLLDVRKIDEFESSRLPQATHVFLGHLPEKLDSLPKDKPVVTFCGSGRRAIIAASILKNNGFERVEDCLGSMAACSKIGCEITSGEE